MSPIPGSDTAQRHPSSRFSGQRRGLWVNQPSAHSRPTPTPQNAWAWLPAKPAAQVTRCWKAPLAAGWGGLLQSRRWGLRLEKRRRLSVRGPEARSGARQRGAAPPLRGTRAQQRRLELHGPLQRRPARHAADGPGTRSGRGGNYGPTSGPSAELASQAGSNGASSTRQRRWPRLL